MLDREAQARRHWRVWGTVLAALTLASATGGLLLGMSSGTLPDLPTWTLVGTEAGRTSQVAPHP